MAEFGLDGYKQSWKDKLFSMSFTYMFLIIILVIIGTVTLYSAANGDWQPWAIQHIMRFVAAFAVMLGIAVIDAKYYYKSAYIFYMVTFLLLVVVELTGHIGMGAQRWINFGVFKLQPSELMKIGIVLFLARYFSSMTLQGIKSIRGLIIPTFFTIIPVALIAAEPDLGTALMVLLTASVMLFAVGVQWWKFAAVGIQSKIAFGSGGLFGKGFLHGTQTHLNFLPEKHTDFIFTMFSEEFGLIGSLTVLFLNMLVIAIGYMFAFRIRNYFARLTIIGLNTNYFLYVFINIAMVMGVLPVVGVPLPLISYGGTVMFSIMASFGIILCMSVSYNSRED